MDLLFRGHAQFLPFLFIAYEIPVSFMLTGTLSCCMLLNTLFWATRLEIFIKMTKKAVI